MLSAEIDKEEKKDRLAGFLVGAQRLGYTLNDAWDLLLHSREGSGILNDDYEFAVHHQGITSARKADAHTLKKYDKSHPSDPDIIQMKLLADLIERAHQQYKIPYEAIFNKMDPQTFMKTCGSVLGNYDDKLIRLYLQ